VNYSIRKFVAILLVFAVYCTGVRATTIVAVITREGIIFATDGVASVRGADGVWRAVGTAQKVVIVQQRFAFASFGYASAAGPQTGPGRYVYNFPAFADRLNRTVPSGVDVSGFADAVESNTQFDLPDFFDPLLRAGQIRIEDVGQLGILIGYIVCGYENGIATVVQIVYRVDWEMKRVVGPFRSKPILVEKPGVMRTLYCYSMCNAVRAISKGNGASYNSAHKIAPKDAEVVAHKAQWTELSLEGSTRLARMVLEVETIANKNRVGLPVSVITMVPNGTATQNTFREWLRKDDRGQ
jgi:hypothetical protein